MCAAAAPVEHVGDAGQSGDIKGPLPVGPRRLPVDAVWGEVASLHVVCAWTQQLALSRSHDDK